MKITIAGTEEAGIFLAAYLTRGKNEVWLFDRDRQRTEKIRRSGIRLEGLSRINSKVNVTNEVEEIGNCEAIILCVRAFDTEETIKSLKSLIGDDVLVLTFQDGIGNIQILNDYAGEDRVIAGIIHHLTTPLDLGVLRHIARGEIIIGRVNKKPLGKARVILGVLNQAGLPTRSTRDINSLIWSKIIVNVGINALSAVTRLKNGLLLEYPGTREVMRQAVSEAVRLAKKKRIKLSYDDPIQKVESFCNATSQNLSSMLQDVLDKRQTEIDFINGAIVRQAKSLGIATPANEALTNLVKTIEASYKNRT